MTEQEVSKLAAEVGFVTDLAVEREWITQQLALTRKQEQQIVAAFHLYKALRNDDQMTKTAQSLREIRASISCLDLRLSSIAE